MDGNAFSGGIFIGGPEQPCPPSDAQIQDIRNQIEAICKAMQTCPQCGRDAVTEGVCGFCGNRDEEARQRRTGEMMLAVLRWAETKRYGTGMTKNGHAT